MSKEVLERLNKASNLLSQARVEIEDAEAAMYQETGDFSKKAELVLGDIDGSREIIAGLVADYESALDSDDIEKGMECRWKLERWLWPLARWYLDNTKE